MIFTISLNTDILQLAKLLPRGKNRGDSNLHCFSKPILKKKAN